MELGLHDGVLTFHLLLGWSWVGSWAPLCKMELFSLLAHGENVCLAPRSEIMELLPAGFFVFVFFDFVLLSSQT